MRSPPLPDVNRTDGSRRLGGVMGTTHGLLRKTNLERNVQLPIGALRPAGTAIDTERVYAKGTSEGGVRSVAQGRVTRAIRSS